MLPLGYIRDPRKQTRETRAKKALELLSHLENIDSSYSETHAEARWNTWKDFHRQMTQALDLPTLQQFQANEKIAPQICGGGGDTYLERLRLRFGESTLSFFLSTYCETLCGDPQDLTSVQGCYITRTAMRHLYHLAVLHNFCKQYYSAPVDFIEIGGGFGNLVRLVTQFSLANRYFSIDYPALLCIQYYCLTEFFDEQSVAVWTGHEYLTGSAESKICLVTPDAAPDVSRLLTKPAVMVSTMAMTEMPPAGQQYYLDNLNVDAIYVFGQTRTTALPLSGNASGKEISNKELFQALAGMCHTVDFCHGDYYSEFLGLVI
ncbi:putative sugar O-methyltransferase [Chloroflexota bacterium]